MFPDTSIELTDEQKDQIEQARKLIPKLQEQIRVAKLAGIDLATQEAELKTLQDNLDKLYRVYVRRIRSVTRP